MRVLVACEESQRVCIAFRKKGHEAYSCDILPCSGGFPEWHIQDDVLKYLDDGWDLIIAHPPCTYLTVAANKYYNIDKYGDKAVQRVESRKEAVDFFLRFTKLKCEKIAIENPIGVMSSIYQKPTQIIQPYQFGHTERKATCLWLKELPKLRPTNIVQPEIIVHKSGRTDSKLHFETWRLPKDERAKIRSRTFIGIAKAMADQWG